MAECSCGCGRAAFYVRSGLSRPCRQRLQRKRAEVAGPKGAPGCGQWLDWEAVERAWARQPVGRPLTQTERLYLIGAAEAVGMPDVEMCQMLGMSSSASRAKARAMRAAVRNGELAVPKPDWLGRLTA